MHSVSYYTQEQGSFSAYYTVSGITHIEEGQAADQEASQAWVIDVVYPGALSYNHNLDSSCK